MKGFFDNIKHNKHEAHPPFSVFNSQNGKWLKRKKFWLSLGIESHLGRSVSCLTYPTNSFNKTSIFDPVLCELIYMWRHGF